MFVVNLEPTSSKITSVCVTRANCQDGPNRPHTTHRRPHAVDIVMSAVPTEHGLIFRSVYLTEKFVGRRALLPTLSILYIAS